MFPKNCAQLFLLNKNTKCPMNWLVNASAKRVWTTTVFWAFRPTKYFRILKEAFEIDLGPGPSKQMSLNPWAFKQSFENNFPTKKLWPWAPGPPIQTKIKHRASGGASFSLGGSKFFGGPGAPRSFCGSLLGTFV